MSILDKFRLGVWNIGIIEKSIEDILQTQQEPEIRWMKHPYKDRFFADPFLYDMDENNYYILVEEFPFYTNIGFISLLTIDRSSMKLLKKQKLISENIHLSYPTIYKNMIVPEAYRSGECCGYILENSEIVEKRLLLNKGLIDQTFLSFNDKEWIFATDDENPLSGLKIFYRDENSNDAWYSHKKNPVKNDITSARSAGHFFSIGKDLYRPVQDSKLRYGHKIHLMHIDELTEENFKETEVEVFLPDSHTPYNYGIHTFNVEDGFIVVDGYREYYSWVVKPLCVKSPSLMRFLGDRDEN